MVPVAHALGPGNDVARLELGLALILDEHGAPGYHHQQFVLAVVPVALARPCAGVEHYVPRAELREPRRLADLALPAPRDRLIERRRIAGAVGRIESVEVNLGHAQSL